MAPFGAVLTSPFSFTHSKVLYAYAPTQFSASTTLDYLAQGQSYPSCPFAGRMVAILCSKTFSPFFIVSPSRLRPSNDDMMICWLMIVLCPEDLCPSPYKSPSRVKYCRS